MAGERTNHAAGDTTLKTDIEDSTEEERVTDLPDGTRVLGDRTAGTINVEYRDSRQVHQGSRKHLKRDFRTLVRIALTRQREREEGPVPTSAEIDAECERRLQAASEHRRKLQPMLDSVAPESAAPDAATVDRTVELAAILRLPVMVWAWLRLLTWRYGPKRRPMWRRLAVAVCLRVGFGAMRPRLNAVLDEFTHDNRYLAWIHHWPGDPPTARKEDARWDLSAFYKQVKKVLGDLAPVTMWEAVNRDMLLELLGEHTFDTKAGGQFANCPDALTYLLVDGFMIQADLPQRAPKDDQQADEWHGEARKGCAYVEYRNQFGPLKKCHGYKWIQISSLKLGGLVLAGDLFPANVDERAATLKLLQRLFGKWPELQQQKQIYLVGDSLYDHSEKFAYELTFRFGIHPVFPRHGKIAPGNRYADTGGVPRCKCGQLATIDQAADFPTPLYRLNHGLAPAGRYIPKPGKEKVESSEDVLDNARIRWRCPRPKGSRCTFSKAAGTGQPSERDLYLRDTYVRENPRLYTYLPHDGPHERAALRTALLCYRNVIESSFSVLKDMGLAGTSQCRPSWAGDKQMKFLAWMGVTTMTARRLVHTNGTYDQTWRKAEQLGLLRAAAPDETTVTAAESVEPERDWFQIARAPAGQRQLGPNDEYLLTETGG